MVEWTILAAANAVTEYIFVKSYKYAKNINDFEFVSCKFNDSVNLL